MPPRADDVVWMDTGASVHDTGRDSAAQIEEAGHIARRLLGYARAIADADGVVAACGQPGCPLEHHPASATAVRLAVGLAGSAAVDELDVVVLPDARQRHLAHRRFVDQLSEAAASVWCCRRSVHREGRCLFDSAGPDSGLCGRVLAVSRHYELGALAG